jgi:cold-inducible RNA-binding protein
MATKTLYVGNLSYSATETDLAQHFSAFGGTNARILEGRGFGFVDIDADLLDAAVKDTNQTEFGGRLLTVNEARPKGEGGSNRGGGLGSGYGGGKSRGSGW